MSSHQPLLGRVREFVASHVLPQETQLATMDDQARSKLEHLTQQARQAELWGMLFPRHYGGQLERLSDFIDIGFEEGKSEFASSIFGGLANVDAQMLDRYGSDLIKEQFLQPLSRGEVTSAYGMTEPDQPGSVPGTLSCRATRDGDHWRIQGSKWYICNATKADYVTVLTVTDPEADLQRRLTMFIVPTSTVGCTMERPLPIFGRMLGQGQYQFSEVQIPDAYRLGEVGAGFDVMHSRVVLGRILRSVHWLGAADRCLELTYQRIHSLKGEATRLADKQLIRQRVFEAYAAITQAKLLVRQAAQQYDDQAVDFNLVNLTKISAANAVSCAADIAIQIYGAEGVGDGTPLAGIYHMARTARILDGAEEALINTIGKSLISAHSPTTVTLG